MQTPLLCSHCNKPISGKYFKDYWGNSYHASHLAEGLQCNYCGKLLSKHLTNGGIRYEDGRVICGLCSKNRVDDLTRGKEILFRVHQDLEKEGVKIAPFKPEFYLIDRLRLRQLSKGEKQGFAIFKRIEKNGTIVEFTMQIFILKGLPASSFESTAAHELMHIWFYSQGIRDANPKLVEGSCNFASYLILKKRPYPEAAYRIEELMKDPSPIYGKGFKRVHKMVQTKGKAYWLNYIRRHKKLPLI